MTALAALLDLSPEETRALPVDPRLSYRPFSVRKRGGGRRAIVAPSDRLKSLQRRVLRRWLDLQPVHEAATAFRPGLSIASHARRHIGQAVVLTVDLADFFPSTAARRIRAYFGEQGWQGESLDVLTRLCVYRGGLPQGAPTSPALSNIVNRPLDEQLSELAAWHGGRYSRYCDDLAFSWGGDEPPAFRVQVEDCLARFGYRVQERKGWRLQRSDQHPEITGLVLSGRRLRLSQSILARLRQAKQQWRPGDPQAQGRLAGYLGLKKMIGK
jgi:hypothetical protein